VAALLEEAQREGVAPGLAACVLHRGETVHDSFHGLAQAEPVARPLGPDLLFDLASLTKVMATTTLAAILVEEGLLAIDDPAGVHLPAFAQNFKGAVTLRHLLTHTSGLVWWRPYHELVARDPVGGALFLPPEERPEPAGLAAAAVRGHTLVQDAVLAEPLEERPGLRSVYSDPNFLVLGWILERVGRSPLDDLFATEVARPLGLERTFFQRAEQPHVGPERCVATERCAHRGEVNCGAVNDDNAWAAGGVAGHAGLFSVAREVAAVGQAWLDALHGRSHLLDREVAEAFATPDATPGSTRALGWDTPSREGSSLGTRLGRGPRRAIGHLGFTGTSLWVDPDAEVVCALLTNRVHPSRENEKIRPFRPRFHDAVAEALGI
jgi:CubicO group peptidase (beta-lactamase class C family)